MAATFSVESVAERPTIDPGGQMVNTTIVYLKTLRGARGSIELPTEQFMALTGSVEGKKVLTGLLQDKADSLEAPFEL